MTHALGLFCDTCGAKLVVEQGRIVCANFLCFFGGIALVVYALNQLGPLLGRAPTQWEQGFAVLAPAALMVLLMVRVSPLVGRVRLADENELVDLPLGDKAATSPNDFAGQTDTQADWVQVGQFDSATGASIAEQRLEAQGIPSSIGEADSPDTVQTGYVVYVPPEQSEDAKAILESAAVSESELAAIALKYPPPDDA